MRRQILGVPDTGAIPPEKLKNFWAVCSTAIVNVAKKVAFVELRTHERATIDPDHAAVQLRELFHSYLNQIGEMQVGERAPAPMSRDIRTALTAMGYAKGGGKGKKHAACLQFLKGNCSLAADRCWLTRCVWAVLVSELLSAIKLIKLCGWEDV